MRNAFSHERNRWIYYHDEEYFQNTMNVLNAYLMLSFPIIFSFQIKFSSTNNGVENQIRISDE